MYSILRTIANIFTAILLKGLKAINEINIDNLVKLQYFMHFTDVNVTECYFERQFLYTYIYILFIIHLFIIDI